MVPYRDVVVSVEDSVASVVIDRPPRNAFVPSTLVEVRAAVAEVDADRDVRCIVLAGTGRYFATGADLQREGLIDPTTGTVDRQLFHAIRNEAKVALGVPYRPVLAARTPVVVAVNGAAAGAGLVLALQGDLRVMASDARYSFAFARRGLAPEIGVSWLLPRLLGISRATELLLTGRVFDGDEAVAMGLAVAAAPADGVVERALALAHDVADGCSPLATAMTKRLIWTSAGEPAPEALAREAAVSEWVIAHGDVGEGITSYLERRAPQWRTSTNEEAPVDWPDLFGDVPEDYL